MHWSEELEIQSHPLYEKFKEYANQKGISLKEPDDWKDWWDCYLSGALENSRQTIEILQR